MVVTIMSPDEARTIRSLSGATFVPGCAPKRFVREMAGKNPDVYILSDRQRGYLWAIAWSYRKQLPDDLVEIARRECCRRRRRGRSEHALRSLRSRRKECSWRSIRSFHRSPIPSLHSASTG